MHTNHPVPKITIFYDGGCPLCSREVAHYKRLDKHKRVTWSDIDQNPAPLAVLGIKPDTAMKHLHLLNREGKLLVGVDAFQAVWSELPYYKVLAVLVSPRPVARVLNKGYNWFAERRYSRRIACKNAEKSS